MEFINLKKQYEVLMPKIDKMVKDIMSDARFIGGTEVSEFEEKLTSYVGRKHCITCGNGTDALMLAYLAYGIGKGDAVFCPDMTFIASIEPACMLGATPIFCDIDSKTYNLSPIELEKKICKVEMEGKLRAKAVVMVDFLGSPADYYTIKEICQRHNLLLIEDAAQSMGAKINEKMCGSFGDIACTSFFPSKPLGCYGDGGAVFTDDDSIAEVIKSIKVHGKGDSKYNNIRIGMNSRLDTIQAAVLLAKLEILEEEMEKRQLVAQKYNEAFNGLLQIPFVAEGCRCSYAQYVMLAANSEQRDDILRVLKEKNIPSLLYYPKELHKMQAFSGLESEIYPNASMYAKCNFGIPFSPYITNEEQELVIKTIKSVL